MNDDKKRIERIIGIHSSIILHTLHPDVPENAFYNTCRNTFPEILDPYNSRNRVNRTHKYTRKIVRGSVIFNVLDCSYLLVGWK